MTILGVTASSILKTNNSFESIATTTVGSSGSSTITFSSIPQTYTHLQLRIYSRTNGNYGWSIGMQLNGSVNLSRYHRFGCDVNSGSGAFSDNGTTTNQTIQTYGSPSSNLLQFSPSVTDILDYTNTNKNKTVRSLGGWDQNAAGGIILLQSSLYLTTSAITSITLTPIVGSFVQYSSFALYGIKVAS